MRAVLVMCWLDSVRCPNNELGDDFSVRGHSNTHVGVSFLVPLLVSHPNRRTALSISMTVTGGGYSGVIVRNH